MVGGRISPFRGARAFGAQTEAVAPPLKIVGFLRVGKTWDGCVRARPRNLHADRRFALGACLSQQGESSQRLTIQLGYQIRVAAIVLLPYLANLNLFRGHFTTLDRIPPSVNALSPLRFVTATPFDSVPPVSIRRAKSSPAARRLGII